MESLNYKSIYTPRNASLVKRAASFLLDVILLMIAFVGFLFLFSAVFNYDEINNALDKIYLDYGVMIPNESTEGYKFCNIEEESCLQAMQLLDKEPTFQQLFIQRQRILIIMPVLSILLALLIFSFIIPLILKNGQTIGKKLFQIGYVSKSEVRIRPIQLFIKFLFGEFIINGVMCILGLYYIFWGNGFVGIFLIFAVLIGNVVCFGLTKNKTFLADGLANMFPIDMQEQMLFDTIEELQKARAEEAKLYAKHKKKY